MKIGISTKCFGGISVAECARTVRSFGYGAVELCLCQNDASYRQYNTVGGAKCPGEEEFIGICDTYRREGLEISALALFPNLWCGSAYAKRKARADFARFLDLADAADISTVSTELGFSAAARPIRGAAVSGRTYTRDDFLRVREAFAFVALEAMKRDITVSIEPSELDPVFQSGAEGYLEFLDGVEDLAGVSGVLGLTLSPYRYCFTLSGGEPDGSDNVPEELCVKLHARARLLHLKEREEGSRYFCCPKGIYKAWDDFLGRYPDIPFAVVEYADDRSAGRALEIAGGGLS